MPQKSGDPMRSKAVSEALWYDASIKFPEVTRHRESQAKKLADVSTPS